MALVKVRTGAVGGEIKRVDQCGIGPVRGVIDGMAVRVRNSKSERRSGASNGELESIVVRRCDVLQREDSAKTRSKRTQTIRVGKILVGSSEAGGFQIHEVRIGVVPERASGVGGRDKGK